VTEYLSPTLSSKHLSVVKALLALCCLLAALIMAAPAAADSLVFTRDNNIWLANADGTGQYQVTLDGTAASPYSSPSQADDGTIVALRTPPGGRPQIWRMHQNGGLLNSPINTPAPGTGAIDARVSPDGQLVAYWFVTQVSIGTCLFCYDLANQVLISHSDRSTNPSEVGTPNTGSVPSWLSNDTLLLSNGSAQELYYRLGMSEAADWWADYQNCGCMPPDGPLGLTEGEVSRDGQRVAVVRGDHQELIWLYSTNGPPPAVPSPRCEIPDPTGRFYRPAWSQDGRTLAWQEGDGIWSGPIPDLANCSTLTDAQLIVPGGSEPDFGPAPVNPGARPACGNPGNPSNCPTPTPTPTSKPTPTTTTTPSQTSTQSTTPKPTEGVTQRLNVLLASLATGLKRLDIHGFLHANQIGVAFTASEAGVLTLRLSTRGRHSTVIATGRRVYSAAGAATVTLKLTSQGSKWLRAARVLRATLRASFAPLGGSPVSITSNVRLKR
jgi:hypothetical protein